MKNGKAAIWMPFGTYEVSQRQPVRLPKIINLALTVIKLLGAVIIAVTGSQISTL
jgi:hypothetical protein